MDIFQYIAICCELDCTLRPPGSELRGVPLPHLRLRSLPQVLQTEGQELGEGLRCESFEGRRTAIDDLELLQANHVPGYRLAGLEMT